MDVPRRRDRLRDATVAEIKRLAWDQIATSGAESLSLRAVARDMGMTSSALYRYFESRDQLVDRLCRDAFASLADVLEGAERSATKRRSDSPATFLAITHAYRRWALDHPTEYTLVYGSASRGGSPDTKLEMKRAINVLFRCMIRGLERGEIHLAPLTQRVERRLRARLGKWAEELGGELSPDALAACMLSWTQLHGAISLELFRHIPEPLLPADDLFEHLMHEVLRSLGCYPP
jgi:AcrR family transcriptional regulator